MILKIDLKILKIDLKVDLLILKGCCPRELHEWKPELKNRFYYFHKRTLRFVQTEILSKDAFMYCHVLNAWEQDSNLVVDIFGMPNFNLVDNQMIVKLRAGERIKDQDSPKLYRYVIPLVMGDLKNVPIGKNLATVKNCTATAIRVDNKIILEPELMSNTFMDFSTWNPKVVN